MASSPGYANVSKPRCGPSDVRSAAIRVDAVSTASLIDGASIGEPVLTITPAVRRARIDRHSIFGIPSPAQGGRKKAARIYWEFSYTRGIQIVPLTSRSVREK